MLFERGLANFMVRVASRPQLIAGSVFQHQQGVIGPGQRLHDLIELALSGRLLASLGVLDDKDHGQGKSRNQRLKYAFA